jgi:hypothetical protein
MLAFKCGMSFCYRSSIHGLLGCVQLCDNIDCVEHHNKVKKLTELTVSIILVANRDRFLGLLTYNTAMNGEHYNWKGMIAAWHII